MGDDYADRLTRPALIMEHDAERDFESRVIESSNLAFRVAFGVLRNRSDAEDVAQEAFVRAHRAFDRLRDRGRFRAWLVRVTWRLAIDRLRSDRRRAARDLRAVEAADARNGEGSPSHVRSIELWAAIDALPDKLRLVTVLAGIEGHNVREVAALLELPEGTVKSRLFLARRQLKERLS